MKTSTLFLAVALVTSILIPKPERIVQASLANAGSADLVLLDIVSDPPNPAPCGQPPLRQLTISGIAGSGNSLLENSDPIAVIDPAKITPT
jgi:hypothetical protein